MSWGERLGLRQGPFQASYQPGLSRGQWLLALGPRDLSKSTSNTRNGRRYIAEASYITVDHLEFEVACSPALTIGEFGCRGYFSDTTVAHCRQIFSHLVLVLLVHMYSRNAEMLDSGISINLESVHAFNSGNPYTRT